MDSRDARAPTPSNPSNLAYAAYEFREALIPLQGITPDRCDGAATELRNRALVAEERFFAAVAGLPRRERTLAGHWENAAVMRYRHGLEVFARAEDLGADMLAQLATHRRPSLPALTELCDVCTHARTLDQHQRPEMFGAITAGRPPDGFARSLATRPAPTMIGPPGGPALSIKLNFGGGSAAI